MAQPVKVIGISDNGRESLLPLYEKWILQSERLVGGERHLHFFPEYTGEKLMIKGGLAKLVDTLQSEPRDTVILASGDHLFYGIGGYLSQKLPVEFYPNLSSIQLAFAKMGESWQDAFFTSVHGRSMKGLAQRIDRKHKVAILTDRENSPNALANYLLSYGMIEYRAFVGENLGGEQEKFGWYDLNELADHTFSDLNVMILKKGAEGPQWPMGIDDHEFFQRKPDKGLITKKEIRVLSLSNMNLRQDSVVWDIGTCTGSVAIEAARIACNGEVYAIEKNEKDLKNCYENMRKFRTDFTAVLGKAPSRLEEFPDPDAVFIGGSGGELQKVLHVCCSRLHPGGRIVLNAATIETMHEAVQTFEQEGFAVQISLVQLSRNKPILNMNRFEALNPVFIITASRKKGE